MLAKESRLKKKKKRPNIGCDDIVFQLYGILKLKKLIYSVRNQISTSWNNCWEHEDILGRLSECFVSYQYGGYMIIYICQNVLNCNLKQLHCFVCELYLNEIWLNTTNKKQKSHKTIFSRTQSIQKMHQGRKQINKNTSGIILVE